MTPRRKKADGEDSAHVAEAQTAPAEPEFVTDDGRFDAVGAAEYAIEQEVGDAKVLPRRRAYATVLHTTDVAAAGKPLPLSATVKAALRVGEP